MSNFWLKVYAGLMQLAQPLLRYKLARRGRREPGYLHAVQERFAHYSQPAESSPQLVWVHAVSLGETRVAEILLLALRQQYPGLRVLLTHGTATGRDYGQRLLQPGDLQVWQPWDSLAPPALFLAHFQPRLGLLLETEVWPNLMAAAQVRSIPVVLLNARLSEKSYKKTLRWSALMRPAYAALHAVYAQTELDAQRLQQLGAPVAGVFGNIKFDAAPSTQQQEQGRRWREAWGQPVLMLASSREGEEAQFLEAIAALSLLKEDFLAIKSKAIQAKLPFKILVVPRHPQRFDAVEKIIEQHGFIVSRRSHWQTGEQPDTQALQADVWLGDSLGEMALYYALSHVALLGGSFAPCGGQNLIEAAACACPVIMGPHTFNFSDAAVLAQAAGAALRVPDMAAALELAHGLLQDPAQLQQAAAASLTFAKQHQGATARTVAALGPCLGPA